MKQREAMRQLWRRFQRNEQAVIRAYAEMERRGEVERDSNVHNITPEQYAKALLKDGVKKGWLELP